MGKIRSSRNQLFLKLNNILSANAIVFFCSFGMSQYNGLNVKLLPKF